MDNEKKELCSITIMFPVDTDEEALAVKRKIAEVLKGNEKARVDFRISTLPPYPGPKV